LSEGAHPSPYRQRCRCIAASDTTFVSSFGSIATSLPCDMAAILQSGLDRLRSAGAFRKACFMGLRPGPWVPVPVAAVAVLPKYLARGAAPPGTQREPDVGRATTGHENRVPPLARGPQTLYISPTGKPLSLPKSCSKNESVPNFSFLTSGSTGAAGRHYRKPKIDQRSRRG
jgi:hypothetical protein